MSEGFKSGIYKHYKGGLYRALFIAEPGPDLTRRCVITHGRLSEDRDVKIEVYIELEPSLGVRRLNVYHEYGKENKTGTLTAREYMIYMSLTNGIVWARPYNEPGQDSWYDFVTMPDGERWPRFTFVGEELVRDGC